MLVHRIGRQASCIKKCKSSEVVPYSPPFDFFFRFIGLHSNPSCRFFEHPKRKPFIFRHKQCRYGQGYLSTFWKMVLHWSAVSLSPCGWYCFITLSTAVLGSWSRPKAWPTSCAPMLWTDPTLSGLMAPKERSVPP